MGSTVDKRIVEMSFDNKQFQSGVSTTLQALADLKKGLNLSDAVKGIGNISDSFKNFTLGKIAGDVDTLNSKFSLLGIAAFGVITNLAGAVVDLGTKIFNAVSGMEAIRGGLTEYETQINAIQTILANTASKGTTMGEVTDALDELNTYADKTIYNFTEMTKNIGTFTAAGVDLDVSVAGIKGIANLAAVSGSTSQQASTGMYQLSQAIASGTVKLMDWNSVTNAGMGGELFKNSLLETAEVHGSAVTQMIADGVNFRETLQSGWLTSEILLETLAKFTGDLNEETLLSQGYTKEQAAEILNLGVMANEAATKIKTFTQLMGAFKEQAVSGWVKTWQLIIGDFYQARDLWGNVATSLGGMIDASADARNKVFSFWNKMGGRDKLIYTISLAFDKLLQVIAPIKEAFREVFPPITGSTLYGWTIALKEFVKGINITAPGLDKLKRIFKGIFAVVDIFRMAIVGLIKAFFGFLKPLGLIMPSFTDLLANVADWIVKLRDGIKSTDAFSKIFGKMYEVISSIFKIFGFAGIAVYNFGTHIVAFVKVIKEKLIPVLAPLKPILDNIKETFGAFASNIVQSFKNFKMPDLSWINTFGLQVKESFMTMLDGLKPIDTTKLVAGFDKLKEFFSGFKGATDDAGKSFSGLGSIFENIGPKLSKAAESIGKAFTSIKEAIKGALEKTDLGGVLDTFDFGAISFDNVFENFQKLLATGLLGALALAIVKFVKKGSDMFGGVSDVLSGVADSLKAWQNNLNAKTLMEIAKAVALIAIAVLVLSFIDSEKLSGATTAITVMFADLMASFIVFSKMGGGLKGLSSIGVLMGITTSLLILSVALLILSKMDWEDMANGLTGLMYISGIIIASSHLLSKNSGKFLAASIGLSAYALGILAIASVVRMIGGMDPGRMAIGLLVISAVLAQFIIFSRTIGSPTQVAKAAISMVLLAGALMVVAGALMVFGMISPEQTLLSMGAMAASLTILVGALVTIPDDAVAKAGAIVIMAAAMVVLAGSLWILASIDPERLWQAVIMFGGSLAILVVALKVMETSGIRGAAALLITAVAITMLSGALVIFGNMEWEQIAKALGMLAGLFLVLGLGAVLIAPVIPIIIALSVAIFIMGAAALVFGQAVRVFAVGFAILVALGAAGIAVAAGFILMFIEMMPLIVKGVGKALNEFLDILLTATPKIVKILEVLLLSLIDMFIAVIPKAVEAIVVLITALVDGLLTTVPMIVEAALVLITALLTSIRDHIYEITTLAMDIIIEFCKAMTEKIPEIVPVVAELITTFLDSLALELPKIIESAWNFILDFITAMTESIDENIETLITKVAELAKAIVDGVIKGLTGDAVTDLWETIKGVGKLLLDNFKEILGIESPSEEFKKLAGAIIQGLIDGLGVKTFLDDLWKKIKFIATELIAKIKQELGMDEGDTFSSKFKEVATFIVDGLLAGLGLDAVKKIISAVTGIGQKMIDAIKLILKQDSPSKVFEDIGIETGAGLTGGLEKGWEMESPSKLLAEMGLMAIRGLANGLLDAIPLTVKAAKEIGEQTTAALDKAVSNISGMLDANMELNPTIRPVIDLTEVLEGGKTIDEYFGKDKMLSLSVSLDNLSRINTTRQDQSVVEDKVVVKEETPPQAISFVQNNYSPESLSRLEIYRMTRNQLAVMKGLVTP